MLNLNQKPLTIEQEDEVVRTGNLAEGLVSDDKLLHFINLYKFEIVTELSGFSSHSDEVNNKRVALANYISGIDGFLDYLQKSINARDRIEIKRRGAISP